MTGRDLQHQMAAPEDRRSAERRFRDLDGHDPARLSGLGPQKPSATTWLGLGVLFVIAVLFVLPLESFREVREARATLEARAVEEAREHAEAATPEKVAEVADSLELTKNLASAARALAEIEVLRREGDARNNGVRAVGSGHPATAGDPSERPDVPSATADDPSATHRNTSTDADGSHVPDNEAKQPSPRHAPAASPIPSPRPLPSHPPPTPKEEAVRSIHMTPGDGPFPPGEPPQGPVPGAASFGSQTACLSSYLPEIAFSADELDFVCRERQLWTIERQVYATMGRLAGRGGEMWRRLGPYTLVALATMRAGCCRGAEPVLAVVPTLSCGILRDVVRKLGPIPEPEPFTEVHAILECLEARKAHFPQRWSAYPNRSHEAAFRMFTEHAWARAKRP